MSLYLAYDIGGTNLKAALVDESYQIIDRANCKAEARERSGEDILDSCLDLAMTLLQRQHLEPCELKAIGMGAPGLVSEELGEFVRATNLNFLHLPVREIVQARLKRPVHLVNDANAAALAEAKLGAGRESSSSVLIILGTGLGAGICFDGKLFTGFNGMASELGHHVIAAGGQPCGCGRRGCFEQYVSATALIRETEAAIAAAPDSLLASLAQRDGKVSGRTAFAAAEKHCPIAGALLSHYYENLAEGLANVINTLMPEVIILGGGLSHAGEVLRRNVEEKIQKKLFLDALVPSTCILLAELGNDAGLIGAALYAEQRQSCD